MSTANNPASSQARPRWVPERPSWKKIPNDRGMRAVGRVAVALRALFGSRSEGRPGILMYHRLAPHVPGLPAPLHNVTPRRFRRQLTGLLDCGFRFVPLTQLLDAAEHGETVPPHSVAVTFDDGFASVFEHGRPVLEELGIPATVFVNTAYLDSADPFPFDAWGVAYANIAPVETYRPLALAECREMLAGGLIDIGTHTHTHEDFRDRPADFHVDLVKSIDIVRRQFAIENVTFAFPYGSRHAGFASSELQDAARAAGARCGLTTAPELVNLEESPFDWGRFNVFAWDTAATLAAKLDGWYGWAPRLKQSLARKLSLGSAHSASAAGLATTLHEACL